MLGSDQHQIYGGHRPWLYLNQPPRDACVEVLGSKGSKGETNKCTHEILQIAHLSHFR